MHLIWRRYSRSGVAPLWFYAGMAVAFGALVVWATVERDWLAVVLSAVMAPVALAGSWLMRGVRDSIGGASASTRAITTDDDGPTT